MTEPAKGMLIANLSIGTADKDYPLTLPARCKHFCFQCRDAGITVRMAIEADKAGPAQQPYWTLKPSTRWSESALSLDAESLIFLAADAPTIIEAIFWF